MALLLSTGSAQRIQFVKVADGLSAPVFLTHAPKDPSRLFVVEQRGKIRVWEKGRLLPDPFLDLSQKVSCCGERGLLGLAFHPQYAKTGYFFVNYTNQDGNTVIARYQASADSGRADASSATIFLTIQQPYANHNGGMIAFGPDGYLYIGMGDGGSGGDPHNNAQNKNTLLGKILRIDVDSGSPYGIPQDNPFVGKSGVRPEIWAYGLRNPWRFSFDRKTGDLWIGDVGQGRIEEIDLQPASSRGGENYGWKLMEGSECFLSDSCNKTGLVLPVAEYDHSQGCSVTGGYVYRGKAVPSLAGTYIYGDYCSGRVWGATRENGKWEIVELARTTFSISSFGEDAEGELYLADHKSGTVYKLTGK